MTCPSPCAITLLLNICEERQNRRRVITAIAKLSFFIGKSSLVQATSKFRNCRIPPLIDDADGKDEIVSDRAYVKTKDVHGGRKTDDTKLDQWRPVAIY